MAWVARMLCSRSYAASAGITIGWTAMPANRSIASTAMAKARVGTTQLGMYAHQYSSDEPRTGCGSPVLDEPSRLPFQTKEEFQALMGVRCGTTPNSIGPRVGYFGTLVARFGLGLRSCVSWSQTYTVVNSPASPQGMKLAITTKPQAIRVPTGAFLPRAGSGAPTLPRRSSRSA